MAALRAIPMTAPTEATAYVAVLPQPTLSALIRFNSGGDLGTHSDNPPPVFPPESVPSVIVSWGAEVMVDVRVCETPGVIVTFPPPPSKHDVSSVAVEFTVYLSPVPPVPYPRASLNMIVKSLPAFKLTSQSAVAFDPKSTSKGSNDWSREMTVMLNGGKPESTV